MRKKATVISYLVCSVCGLEMSVPRIKNQLREKWHVKDMYCPCCKKVSKFIEVGKYGNYQSEEKDKKIAELHMSVVQSEREDIYA